MLTSIKNPRIQHIRKLQSSARVRRSEQLFAIEGVRLAEEALQAGWVPKDVFFTEGISARGKEAVTAFQNWGVKATLVAPHVMQAASDTQTPQGILVLLPIQKIPLPKKMGFLVILDGIRDPGNLGTILRTGLAARIDALLLSPGTVDPFAPKVVRAAMGAHFKLPICTLGWDKIRELVTSLPLKPYLADTSSGQRHSQSDFISPLALIIGGEAAGAGQEARELATTHIHIEMPGEAESLNAAVASAILMFEVVRQRQELLTRTLTPD